MPFNVLIIDDDEMVCEIMEMVFLLPKYFSKAIFGGMDLVNTITEFKPDIILLDIMLGTADGREVCRMLKADPLQNGIPVILLSAAVIDHETLDCGQDAFIEKPFDIVELEGLVWKTLNTEKYRQ